MRKFNILLIVLMIMGCTAFQPQQEQIVETTIYIAGKHLAIEGLKKVEVSATQKDVMIETADILIEALEGGGDPAGTLDLARMYLMDICKDPILKDDLKDLFDLMEASLDPDYRFIPDDPQIQTFISRFNQALLGFKRGLELSKVM